MIGARYGAPLLLASWLAACAGLAPHIAYAADDANPIAQLRAAGRLEVNAEIVPADNIVPGQKLGLILEIATDRWFSGGTRIEIPEIPGLVILQTETFASNSSEVRQGQSWVVQRWTVDVYPQRAGDFSIGPIPLQVKVNDEQAGGVAGELLSPTVTFSAVRPEGLEQAEQWVASPDYRVSQSFDRELDSLAVGDALEREIRFQASDIMAMMLPGFQAEELPGLAVYPEPPVLTNNNNRGVTEASRVERISYIAEAPGTYQLPARDYFWWDTEGREVQLLSLPAVEIQVLGTAAEQPGPAARMARQLEWRDALWALPVLLVLLLLWKIRHLPPLPLATLRSLAARLAAQWRQLRKPALPARLNPGSNAGD